MNFMDKAFWYDWGGANVEIFKIINSLQGDIYDALMLLLSRIGDHHHLPYYLGILLAYVLVTFIIRQLRSRGGTQQVLILWLGVFLVLIAGYAVEGVTVKVLKSSFSYPRPYVVMKTDDTRVLEKPDSEKDFQGFPSGHAAFITLMVAGMWPVLSSGGALIGTLLIFGVCWSRIALGVHFPADVVSGFFIGLFSVLLVRAVIYWLLHKLFRIRC